MSESDLVDRALARHSSHGAARRSRAGSRASSIDHRLSIIDEDGNAPPPRHPPPTHQTHNRSFSRRFLGDPPRYREGKEPPKYSFFDVIGPKGEKFEDLRNNAYVAGRGGWKRICLITLVVIACLVALIVGLVVGLRKKNTRYVTPPTFPIYQHTDILHHYSASPAPSPTPSSSPNIGPFPAGSYTFETFLDTTSTNCTSNARSWQCEPSVTYATSPTDSMATFNWIITASDPKSPTTNFTISSTNNPFSINFDDAALTLQSKGTDNERYTFKTTVQKVVFPAINVKCFYNDTQFAVNIYTKKPKSYPPNSGGGDTTVSAIAGQPSGGAAGAPAGGAFGDWQYAVDATQSISGGVDVPACYNVNNGQTGNRITEGYTIQPAQDFCSCAYKNYDP